MIRVLLEQAWIAEQQHQHGPGDEAADVRPEGHTAALGPIDDPAAQELHRNQ